MIDPNLFGNNSVGPAEGLTLYPASQVGSVTPTPANPTAPAAAFAGSQVALEGAANQAAADRERATTLESVGASMNMWVAKGVYDRVTAPTFAAEDGFQPGAATKHIPYKLAENEFTWLQGAKSTDEFNYRKDYIEQHRQMAQAVGDNPIAGMMTSMIDPAFLLATPLTAATVRAVRGGRALSAGLSAASAASLDMAAQGPQDTKGIVLNALVNGAAGAWLYKPGKGMVRADPDFPDEGLRAIADDFGNTSLQQRAAHVVDDYGNQVRVSENVRAEVPMPLRPDAMAAHADVVVAVDSQLAAKGFGANLGEKLQWNMRKTMSNFGPAGRKIADTLFDNNSDLSVNSVESHRSAIRSDLTAHQFVYEDAVRTAMAEDGFGLWQTITSPRKAMANQAKIEREVQLEMFRREQLTRQGRPVDFNNVPPRIKAMADSLDTLHAKALQELKAAGVEGAEDLVQKAGWHHRKWSSAKIEDMTRQFEEAGLTAEKAHQKVVNLVGLGLRRANGWDRQMAYDIGAAIVNRAKRKGYFEDSLFNVQAGEGTMKQFRDLLVEEGVAGPRLERILDVMRQNTDDAGKAGFMKHRVDIDYRASDFINGKQVSLTDMLDNRMTTIVDQYLDGVSTQVAFARKGLRKASDIEDLRSELLHDIADPKARAQAKELFDNTINHMKGLPAGQSVNENMRLMSAYGRMIALANSGLWQATEYATMMKEYGLLKSLKYFTAEMPGFKGLMETAATDKRTSQHLKDILTRHSDQNLRLRPYIHRFEDNFEFGTNDALQLSAQQAGQLVPYVNVMKYVHGHQARMSANLIVNRLEMAARGDAKALAALQKYGLESHVVDRVKQSILEHGAEVDKWDDAVWRSVRPAFAKMMDESVLHQRLGDMPAFAAFDPVGKFMFTYRSFVLTAHNKVLAGGMARDGLGAVSLMMLYQFPLAAMAVQAQSGLNGKGALSTEDMAKKAFGQMGALGAFGEIAAVVSGSKNQFGAPGVIPLDRAMSLVGSVAQGNSQKAADTAFQMLPVISLLQPIRGLKNLNKED